MLNPHNSAQQVQEPGFESRPSDPQAPVISILIPGLLALSLGSLPTTTSDSLLLGLPFPGLPTPQATEDHRFQSEQASPSPSAQRCHTSHMTGLVTACLRALGLGRGDRSPAEAGTHSAPPSATCLIHSCSLFTPPWEQLPGQSFRPRA